MVCLDVAGNVVRPALLWNDAVCRRGVGLGLRAWSSDVGAGSGKRSCCCFTVSKLRWLARHEPMAIGQTAVCLPHDWLTWKLVGGGLQTLVTDRGTPAAPAIGHQQLASTGSTSLSWRPTAVTCICRLYVLAP